MNLLKNHFKLSAAGLIVLLIMMSFVGLQGNPKRVLGYEELDHSKIKYAYVRGKKVDPTPSAAVVDKARKAGAEVVGEAVERRAANSRTFRTNKPNTYVTEIISGGPQYHREADGSWSEIEYEVVSKEEFKKITKSNSLLFKRAQAATTTSTFYPDPDIEINTVDGYVQQDGGGTNWSTNYVNGSGNGANDSATLSIARTTHYYSSGEYGLARGILLFDTAVIPDNETISSATLSVYVLNKWNYLNDSYSYINVFSSNPASTTALVSADFSSHGSTKFASDVTTASINTGSYLDFTLNSNGIGNINKTGVSKFVLREGHDIDNIAPYETRDSQNGITFSTSEVAGTSQDPKLVIVHVGPDPIIKVRKAATESVVNSASLQDDDHLVVFLQANKTYIITGVFFASSTSATPDIKVAFDIPAGATMDIGVSAASDSFRHAQFLESDNMASSEIPITANTPLVISVDGTIKAGATEGYVILRWAQSSSNSNSVSVLEGSYLKVEEM